MENLFYILIRCSKKSDTQPISKKDYNKVGEKIQRQAVTISTFKPNDRFKLDDPCYVFRDGCIREGRINGIRRAKESDTVGSVYREGEILFELKLKDDEDKIVYCERSNKTVYHSVESIVQCLSKLVKKF
jgi:hypothetical protein